MGIDSQNDEKNEGNVLEEFEVDGKQAQVVVVRPEDLDAETARLLVENLTDANFKLLKIPHAQARMGIRELILSVRDRIAGQNLEGKDMVLVDLRGKVGSSEFDTFDGMSGVRDSIDRLRTLVGGALSEGQDDFVKGELVKMGNVIYPDYARSEHIQGTNRRYDLLMKDKQLLGIKVEGKIVAVQGFSKIGDTPGGREVFEFTKVSTLNDPEYRKKGFNSKMKELIFEKIQAEHPQAIWVGASANSEQIKRFKRRGWHVVEMDDQHEAIVAMNVRHPGYAQVMKEQEYKAFYLDPKVDEASWD